MPDTAAKPVRRRRTPAKPPAPKQKDVTELAQAMTRLADALEPLSEHVPVLIEMAQTWNAAATTGRTIGRGASAISSFGKWAASMGVSIAAVWAIIHQKWDAILGAAK